MIPLHIVGKSIGRTKLFEKFHLKNIEGFLGGILFAILAFNFKILH
jgi:CDP-diglyceride synthetase